jgi:hypothetical protein
MEFVQVLFVAAALSFDAVVSLVMFVIGVTWIEQRVKRFSVRELLIVTTVVAVLLGLIAWAGR